MHFISSANSARPKRVAFLICTAASYTGSAAAVCRFTTSGMIDNRRIALLRISFLLRRNDHKDDTIRRCIEVPPRLSRRQFWAIVASNRRPPHLLRSDRRGQEWSPTAHLPHFWSDRLDWRLGDGSGLIVCRCDWSEWRRRRVWLEAANRRHFRRRRCAA